MTSAHDPHGWPEEPEGPARPDRPGRFDPPSGPDAGHPPLDLAAVQQARFTTGRLLDGYHPAQVDAFLLRVQRHLRTRGPGQAAGDRLRPQDVVAQTFSATKFRVGYAQTEVDDFLDRLVLTLDREG